MFSGATLGVEMGASSGDFPSSVLGLVAQAPMVNPAAVAVAVVAAGLLVVSGGGEELLNVEVICSWGR